jgi:putative spermidine/putrescine transport system permease protein
MTVDSETITISSSGFGAIRTHRAGLVRAAMLAPAVVLIALLIYGPLVWLLSRSFSGSESFAGPHVSAWSNYRNLYADRNVLRSYWTSLWLAVVSAGIVAVIGYPVAYTLARLRPRAAAALFVLVLVPFWTSLTVSLFAFQILLGTSGPVNNALRFLHLIGRPLDLLFTSTSVIVGFVYVGLPLMVLPLYASMRRIDRSLVAAAETLGASPGRAFLHVFLPLSFPGVVAGATLVFVTTIGYFIVPQLLGGPSQNTIGQYILHEVQVQNDIPGAAAMTVGLVGMTIVCLAIAGRFVRFDRFWSRPGAE